MAKVKPLADRVLVEAAAAEETTKGGIIIPDTAKEKPQRGKIIAVGTGRVADDGKVTPLSVKAGDTDPVRQVQRNGAHLRRQGLPDHARKRHLRDPQLVRNGRCMHRPAHIPLKTSELQWQPRTSNLTLTPAIA